jgi:hypothetical protein
MAYGLLDRLMEAQDAATFDAMGSLLHDETCSVDDAVWNQSARTLLLPFRRQFHGGTERVVETNALSTIYEKQWMRSEVLVRHVSTWQKHQDQGIGEYSFNEWAFDGRKITIEFCQALVVTIAVDRLEITMADLGFSGKARIKRFRGGAEASSGEVF